MLTNYLRRRTNNTIGLAALPASEQERESPAKSTFPDGDESPQHLANGVQKAEAPRLKVSLRFTRGLSALHNALIGDTAEPSLYQSLKMREHAIEAGERRHGSASFLHQDKEQKASRARQVRQAREAQLGRDQLEDAEKDRAYAEGSEIHLGMLDQEAGGGIGEDASDVLHKGDMQGAATDERDWDDENELQDDAAGDDPPDDSSRGQRRQNFRSDRLHERGELSA